MISGTVKWFNDAKGFGFLEPDGGGADIFAHFSCIAMEGFKTLAQGAHVTFELTQGPKGLLAQQIRTVEAASSGIGDPLSGFPVDEPEVAPPEPPAPTGGLIAASMPVAEAAAAVTEAQAPLKPRVATRRKLTVKAPQFEFAGQGA